MAKFDGIDLGTLFEAQPNVVETVNKVKAFARAGVFLPRSVSSERAWVLRGHIMDPTQAQLEDLRALSGRMGFLDLPEMTRLNYGFGVCTSMMGPRLREGAVDIYDYELTIEECISVGTIYLQTATAYLHDLAYRDNIRDLNPFWKRCNLSIDANRLNYQLEFYMDNDHASSAQTLIGEVFVGDDVNKFKLYYWTGSQFTLIGDWGGGDAWGAEKNFTDPLTTVHYVRANKGNRGETVTDIGTISMSLGPMKRVLFKVTNLLAQGQADKSTDYGDDQVLLRAIVEHTARETGRPVVVTYIDASVHEGVA